MSLWSLWSQAESSPCDQVFINHMPRSNTQDSVWAPEPGNCRTLEPVLEVVVLVCVSCPNVQSVLGGLPLFASAQRHLPGILYC